MPTHRATPCLHTLHEVWSKPGVEKPREKHDMPVAEINYSLPISSLSRVCESYVKSQETSALPYLQSFMRSRFIKR